MLSWILLLRTYDGLCFSNVIQFIYFQKLSKNTKKYSEYSWSFFQPHEIFIGFSLSSQKWPIKKKKKRSEKSPCIFYWADICSSETPRKTQFQMNNVSLSDFLDMIMELLIFKISWWLSVSRFMPFSCAQKWNIQKNYMQ